MAKNLPANARDVRDRGLIPGSGRSSGEGNGTALRYSCLENPTDRGEPGRLLSMGLQESDTTQQLNHYHLLL